MTFHMKAMIAAAVIGVASAPALAATPRGASTANTSTTSQVSSGKPSGNAYVKVCQGQSKRHVKGQPGTPFSKCVTDMAKLAHGTSKSPAKACSNESKRHVAGQKGTPFSECVSAAAKLMRAQHQG